MWRWFLTDWSLGVLVLMLVPVAYPLFPSYIYLAPAGPSQQLLWTMLWDSSSELRLMLLHKS